MATIEIDDEKIQELLEGTGEWPSCWSRPKNQILQAEMTEHLGPSPEERTSGRQGYRNGSYKRKLTTRVGRFELEVPRDREGEFQTALFQRLERSEKALVLALMQLWPTKVCRRAASSRLPPSSAGESSANGPPIGSLKGSTSRSRLGLPVFPGGAELSVLGAGCEDMFWTDWSRSDSSRFPARIRAAATVLREEQRYGRYRIVHEEGDLLIEPLRDWISPVAVLPGIPTNFSRKTIQLACPASPIQKSVALRPRTHRLKTQILKT